MVNVEEPTHPLAIFAEGSIVTLLDQRNDMIDGVKGQLCTLKLYPSVIKEYDLPPRPDNIYKFFYPNEAIKPLRHGSVAGRIFFYCDLLAEMKTDDEIGQYKSMLISREKELWVAKAEKARLENELYEAKVNIKNIVREQTELIMRGIQAGRQMSEDNNK